MNRSNTYRLVAEIDGDDLIIDEHVDQLSRVERPGYSEVAEVTSAVIRYGGEDALLDRVRDLTDTGIDLDEAVRMIEDEEMYA